MAHLIMGHGVSWYFGTKLAPNYFVKAHGSTNYGHGVPPLQSVLYGPI